MSTSTVFNVRACHYFVVWMALILLVVSVIATVGVAQTPMEMKQETLTSKALAGNLLGNPAERTVYILLPPSYATSDRRYPVVYVMPWGDGDPYVNAKGFKSAMNSLLHKGEVKEMIVVIPDGIYRFGPSLFLSSPILGDYETYVTQEVVEYIETHYRTLSM